MNELPFRTLLYRYFFFGWLFKDVNRGGDMFERAAAMRHNRRMAGWLPKYMLRWLWWSLIFYALAGGAELVLDAPELARWLYALSAMWLAFNVPVALAWVNLTQQSEQH